jgi:NAD(P)-dependent dehydrogenase (short-subunit alcohol dehydrogenase family)
VCGSCHPGSEGRSAQAKIVIQYPYLCMGTEHRFAYLCYMSKKIVLITGANKSIGFEIARQMAKAGYHIILGSRDKANGEQAVKKLKAEGFNDVDLLLIDVSDQASVNQAKAKLESKLQELDVLVNNAGISGGFPQSALTVSVDTVKKVYETNVFGPIRVTQAFIGLLRKSEQPRIVNVTSDLGSLTDHNNPNWAYYAMKSGAYGPSKTALNAYTVALAYELRDTAFKVNAVNPGYTATDFNAHRGTKSVADGAAVIVKYATIGADGPTGHFLSDYGETPW